VKRSPGRREEGTEHFNEILGTEKEGSERKEKLTQEVRLEARFWEKKEKLNWSRGWNGKGRIREH